MTPESMPALQVLAFVVTIILLVGRVYVAWRKRWLPRASETWGCALFCFACLMCLFLSVYWAVDGFEQVAWRKKGYSKRQIRIRLLEEWRWKGIYACTIISGQAMWYGKFAFLLLYYPSFHQFSRRAQIWYIFSTIFTFACAATIFFSFVFWCFPIHRNWNPLAKNFCSTPLQSGPLNMALSFSIVSDMFLFAIPMILILQLQNRSHNEVMGIIFLIVLGLISVIIIAYFVIDLHVNGFIIGKVLTLEKRNVFIVDQVYANVLLLAAIAMPSVRVLFRWKMTSKRPIFSLTPMKRSADTGTSDGGASELATKKLFEGYGSLNPRLDSGHGSGGGGEVWDRNSLRSPVSGQGDELGMGSTSRISAGSAV